MASDSPFIDIGVLSVFLGIATGLIWSANRRRLPRVTIARWLGAGWLVFALFSVKLAADWERFRPGRNDDLIAGDGILLAAVTVLVALIPAIGLRLLVRGGDRRERA